MSATQKHDAMSTVFWPNDQVVWSAKDVVAKNFWKLVSSTDQSILNLVTEYFVLKKIFKLTVEEQFYKSIIALICYLNSCHVSHNENEKSNFNF